MNRQHFIKQTLGITALAVLSPVTDNLFAHDLSNGIDQSLFKDELFERMVKANDRVVQKLLDVEKRGAFGRRVGYEFAALVSGYVADGSAYYHQPLIISALEKIVTQLLAVQAPDGTVSIGNLESPPDTAFLLEPLCAGAKILREHNAPGSSVIQEKIKTFFSPKKLRKKQYQRSQSADYRWRTHAQSPLGDLCRAGADQ